MTTKREKDLLYTASSAIVLPSRYRRGPEAWGLVLNEAAQAGLPLIASDMVGAAGDLVQDGISGLVVPAEDPIRLAEGLRNILRDDTTRLALGAAARENVSRITPASQAKAFDEAIDYSLAHRSSS